jgi:catechol 2,3-dioxygenase-like lactoylglutathione lyase family enzyme
MLQKLSHVTVWVLDQDRAAGFYVDKLGFEIRTDQSLGGFRWLTVGPKGQKEIELVLLPVAKGPMLDDTHRAGAPRGGEEGGPVRGRPGNRRLPGHLRGAESKGVEFHAPPAERPYGVEAVFRDDSGNYYSVVERPTLTGDGIPRWERATAGCWCA